MADIDTNIHDYYNSVYPGIQINQTDGIIKQYNSLETDYEALINGVAMRDVSFMGMIEFQGKDTLDFLHRISTNQILGIQPYTAKPTIFTNEKGRIIDRTILLNLDTSQLLIGSASFRQKLYAWVNKYIIVEDIKTNIANGKFSLFELMGRQAESFLTLIFGKEIGFTQPYEIKKVNIERAEYLLFIINEFGVKKYCILSNQPDTLFLVRYMHENTSVFDFKMVGEESYNIFRVEKGIPAAPAELNDQYNPHESKIINEVSFTKGCYIGQEVIARLDTYDKVQRELTCVILDRIPETDESITLFYNTNEAGKITSVIYSQSIKQPMGLAYIKKEFLVNGNQFTAKDKSGAQYGVTLKTLR